MGLRGGVFKELWPRLSSAHTQLGGSERLPPLPHASRTGRERGRRLSPSVVRVPALVERDLPAAPRDLVRLVPRSRAIALIFPFLIVPGEDRDPVLRSSWFLELVLYKQLFPEFVL